MDRIFAGTVDDLVDGDERKVVGHEFDDGTQAVHGGAHPDAGKAQFGNGRVDDPLRAELVEHALADLVGAVVFGYFFAHQEHGRIAAHLFRHGFPQCLSELYFSHGLNLWK
jgi:hypothetical protein